MSLVVLDRPANLSGPSPAARAASWIQLRHRWRRCLVCCRSGIGRRTGWPPVLLKPVTGNGSFGSLERMKVADRDMVLLNPAPEHLHQTCSQVSKWRQPGGFWAKFRTRPRVSSKTLSRLSSILRNWASSRSMGSGLRNIAKECSTTWERQPSLSRETVVPIAVPAAIVLFAEVKLNYHMVKQTCGRIIRFRSLRPRIGHEGHPERMQ